MKNIHVHFFLLLIIYSFPERFLYGQLVADELPDQVSTDFGGGLQYWKAKDDHVAQFTLPVTLSLPISDRFKLDFTTASTRNRSQTARAYRLSGMTDARILGSYMLENERVLFTFGLNLPSGKNRLTVEELNVASILSLHALNFQVPVLGQGFDASAGVILAQPVGLAVLGIGVGFLSRGKYNPFEGVDLTYDPGGELSFSLGVDVPLSRKDKFYLDLAYTSYSADRSNGVAVFQAGNRLTARATLYLPGELWSFLASANSRVQGKNRVGTDELVPERLNTNNLENEVSFYAFQKWSRKTTLYASAKARLYADNAAGFGATKIAGLGTGLQTMISPHLQFSAILAFDYGTLNTGSQTVRLFGLNLSGAIKIYF